MEPSYHQQEQHKRSHRRHRRSSRLLARGSVSLLVIALLLVCRLAHGQEQQSTIVEGEGSTQQEQQHWLRRTQEQQQQRRSLWLVPLLETLFPFFRPNDYPMQPVDSFNRYVVCTDISRPNCDASNVIRFTNAPNPGPTEFRYHDSGPAQMQGVFWTKMLLSGTMMASTDLTTFAKTRHGGGVQTGVLQENQDGYVTVVRPIGDHSWSRSSNFPAFYLAYYDALYLFKLVDGTLADPRKFVIDYSFKFFFSCLRFSFGQLLSPFIGRYEMELITDPNDPMVKQYPGSVIWKRRSVYFNLIAISYHSIQVVNGAGEPIPTAYQEWQKTSPINYVTGLRDDGLDRKIVC